MPEVTKATAVEAGDHGAIRNSRDLFGGLTLVALALVSLWAGSDLPGQQGSSFGPGTAPRLFAMLLVMLGCAVACMGLVKHAAPSDRFTIRGPMFVTASVLTFAATIQPLGLVLSSFFSFVVAGAASSETKWFESVIAAASLTAFCAVLFPHGLALPFPLWPTLWRV